MRTPRAPHIHKFITQLVMANVPANDSEIMPAPRHVENPRHRDLADELRPLLDWRRLSNPNAGSWAEPANDNVDLTHEGFQPGVEAELEQRPSPEELKRAWEAGGVEAAQKFKGKDTFGTPKGPDERLRDDRSETKERARTRLAIDALKYVLEYVQGEPTAPAELPDEHWRHIPTKYPENAEKVAAQSLLATLGVSRDVPFAKARERWGLPPVANDNRPAFPWRPADPREIFYTGRIRGNPRSAKGGEFNDGVSSAEAQRHEFAHLRAKLSKDEVKVLDIAVEAQNFAEVGEAFGLKGKAAERRGKQLVLKACAELKAALAKG